MVSIGSVRTANAAYDREAWHVDLRQRAEEAIASDADEAAQDSVVPDPAARNDFDPMSSASPKPAARRACACAIDFVSPWAVTVDENASDAAGLYGDPAFAPMILKKGASIHVTPDLFTPERREQWTTALGEKVYRDLEKIANAHLRGESDAFGAAFEEVLRSWSDAPKNEETATAFDRFLKGARAIIGNASDPVSSIALASGSGEAGVRALLANTARRDRRKRARHPRDREVRGELHPRSPRRCDNVGR